MHDLHREANRPSGRRHLGVRPRRTFRRHCGVAVSIIALVTAGCGGAAGSRVADGTYRSLVPSPEQFAADTDGDLPGGLVSLRDSGIDRVDVDIDGDQITFRLDGITSQTLDVVERVDVTDREGSGPFKGDRQLLVLAESLVVGGLVIDEPVVWPGTFEDSPVITVKPHDPDERGPDVSCRSDEPCLLLSSGVAPSGSYADANDPGLDENPIASIAIDDEAVDITLDTGEHVMIDGPAGSTTACGLSENPMWDVPPDVGLPIDDPVLVHTMCPTAPGAAIQLVVLDRSTIPVLAPLTEQREGQWCTPGPECLLFVPE